MATHCNNCNAPLPPNSDLYIWFKGKPYCSEECALEKYGLSEEDFAFVVVAWKQAPSFDECVEEAKNKLE